MLRALLAKTVAVEAAAQERPSLARALGQSPASGIGHAILGRLHGLGQHLVADVTELLHGPEQVVGCR